ncbi:hypothetical protein M976_03779 [Buttiauxella ferragutiae ATCC 51602]|uniref:Uncharacterized protein n=2 Tax=Buttiauxella ferragutiae TaxID=82989 RepID=A0ABX2W3Z1_9ENTR|nr:hypothetical protein M976_03779 [Buttiauxella ferragutiae ATCC 51602]
MGKLSTNLIMAMFRYLKCVLLVSSGLISSNVFAEQYGTPVSICLNNHTIPFIDTDRPATKVVDAAYQQCREVILQWDKERKSLPPEMVASQNEEFHSFYVHMIEARRRAAEKIK